MRRGCRPDSALLFDFRKGPDMRKTAAVFVAFLFCLSFASFTAAGDAAYTETNITIDAGDHAIPATVCLPAGSGPYPAVVLLHGTGSSRDEGYNAFVFAAHVFAESYGVASIRIDMMGSGDSTADYADYTFESAVGDTVKAAEYMQSLDAVGAGRIGVLGWSQGGTDALLSAGRRPDLFKAVVTWAGAPDLSDFLNDERMAEAQANGYFELARGGGRVLRISLQWCLDVLRTDVLGEFSAFPGPVLAIAGTDDTDVNPLWAFRIAAANRNPGSRIYLITNADHTFNLSKEPDKETLLDTIHVSGEFFAETLR